MTDKNNEIKDNAATVSEDMKMTPGQIRIRKAALIQRVFAVANILIADGLETDIQYYLSRVFDAAEAYVNTEEDMESCMENDLFTHFVNSMIHAMKMIFCEPLTGETRDFAWPEIEAIEHELKHFTDR